MAIFGAGPIAGLFRRRVEYRLACSCGLKTAWRVERQRVPVTCWAQSKERDMHVAVVQKRVNGGDPEDVR